MVRTIYQKIRILYLNGKGETNWVNAELDIINRVYVSDNKKIEFDDANIKAVLFNDVTAFNQLIFEHTSINTKKTAKIKKNIKETLIEDIEDIDDKVENKTEE